MNDSFRS